MCVCVYMCVCIYVCKCVRVCVCVNVCVYVYTHNIHALCSQDKKNTNDLLNYCGKSITQKKIQHRFMLNTQQARNRRELPYPGRNPHLAPYLRQKNVKLSPHQEQDNDVCSASFSPLSQRFSPWRLKKKKEIDREESSQLLLL